MATVNGNKGIIIKGTDNWQPVLLNIMDKAGINADVMESFTRRGQSAAWLLSKNSSRYGVIYHLGGCSAIFCVLARLKGKRIVSHWIGTDVMRYHGRLNLIRCISVWVHQHFVNLQLADSEVIQEELKRIGIEARLVRLLPQAIVAEVSSLPEKPVVLSYWDDSRFGFYGGKTVFALARAFPEVKFLIVRASGKGLTEVPANVQFVGPVDNMPEIYRKCTCLIRMPQHDGLSAMVLEAMANGRYVIYNQKCPFTIFAEDFDSARKALEEILRKQQPNSAGADYVKKNFSIDDEARRLRKLMENSLGSV
jgi:glycosyltransferase involved in cell wall biosynthesis